jgi:hypothetical protein
LAKEGSSEKLEKTKMKKLITVCAIVIVMTGAVSTSFADLLVDRGLPTANLNDAAGASRSNVQWADNEATSDPATFYRPGDDFTIAGSGAYTVNTIRVWSTDNTGLSLLGGLADGPITLQSSAFTSTPVTYVGGEGYQGNSGAFSQIYQIDFSVSIALNGGQTYQFFLDGPKVLYDPLDASKGYVDAFLHASDKDTSGSTQEGADDVFLWLAPDGTVKTWFSGTGGGTSGWGSGNNVNSDGNVQVFGVPEPATMCLLGLGALSLIRRKK